jgi:hypothetical protein
VTVPVPVASAAAQAPPAMEAAPGYFQQQQQLPPQQLLAAAVPASDGIAPAGLPGVLTAAGLPAGLPTTLGGGLRIVTSNPLSISAPVATFNPTKTVREIWHARNNRRSSIQAVLTVQEASSTVTSPQSMGMYLQRVSCVQAAAPCKAFSMRLWAASANTAEDQD